MKVAFLITERHDGAGGLENVLCTVYRELTARGHFCKVYFAEPTTDRIYPFSFENSYLSAKIPECLLNKSFWRPRALYRLRTRAAVRDCLNRIAADNMDAVLVLNLANSFRRFHKVFRHFHDMHPDIPLISYPHGSLDHFYRSANLSAQGFSVFSAALAINSGIADDFHRLAPTLPVHIIYNPVQAAIPIPRPDRSARFVYVGRLDRNKRIMEMLRILASLRGDWRLDIVGAGPDDAYTRKVLSLLRQEPYRSRVHHHGWQEQPWKCIESASAVLLHSRSEGFALVLAEAIMRGIPCVAADCHTGPADIIQNDINGWLYPVDDEDMCRRILQEIIDGKRTLPAPDTVRQTAEKFRLDAVVTRMEDALQSIIQTQRRRT